MCHERASCGWTLERCVPVPRAWLARLRWLRRARRWSTELRGRAGRRAEPQAVSNRMGDPPAPRPPSPEGGGGGGGGPCGAQQSPEGGGWPLSPLDIALRRGCMLREYLGVPCEAALCATPHEAYECAAHRTPLPSHPETVTALHSLPPPGNGPARTPASAHTRTAAAISEAAPWWKVTQSRRASSASAMTRPKASGLR